MNPSANGWIKKLLKEISNNKDYTTLSEIDFYNALKLSGFIYGSNISIIHNCIENKEFTEEELSKINLILAFYFIHHNYNKTDDFINSVITFYNTIDNYKSSFFEGLLGKKISAGLLETMINKRVYIDDNLITKNFKYFITNALLFIDIIAYQKFVTSNTISDSYLKDLESGIETIVSQILDAKKNKTKYDEGLIKLFESSLRYQSDHILTYAEIVERPYTALEKYYLIDMACMAFWSDKIIDLDEQKKLIRLGNDLQVSQKIISKSIDDINAFYTLNKDKIAILSSNNMIQSFYKNSSKMVSKLIKRNSKRLLNELRESKELMVLLTKSTTRPLTDEEQKKVQEQLIDIMKSIPSLAIFILPGGAILLPLFVKFIPRLLPSAFDENRIEE
jgi:hypothetical protein